MHGLIIYKIILQYCIRTVYFLFHGDFKHTSIQQVAWFELSLGSICSSVVWVIVIVLVLITLLILDKALIRCINKWIGHWCQVLMVMNDWRWRPLLPLSEVLLEKALPNNILSNVAERASEYKNDIVDYDPNVPDFIINFIFLYFFLSFSLLRQGCKRRRLLCHPSSHDLWPLLSRAEHWVMICVRA